MDSTPPPKKSSKSCSSCHVRMSTKDFDTHIICIVCRGGDCNIDKRCDVCIDWPEERMAQYVSYQALLLKKRLSKDKLKSSKKVDTDERRKGGSLSWGEIC